jgi:hypothetical protein
MIYDVIDINHNNDITSYSGLYNQDGIRRVILKAPKASPSSIRFLRIAYPAWLRSGCNWVVITS